MSTAEDPGPAPRPDETMDVTPAATVGHSTLAHVAGAAGIAGQIVAAYWFLLVPALVVPSPENYLFFVAWAVLVALSIAWWRRHPWRSFLAPIVSIPIVWLVLELGQRLLGWAP